MADSLIRPLVTDKPRRRWRWWIAAVASVVVAAVAFAAGTMADSIVEHRLRPATIQLLEQRFDSDVELASLDVRVFPTLIIRADGLVLRHRERKDIPPLITAQSFTIESTLPELWARRVNRSRIEGLRITIPPRRREDMPGLPEQNESTGETSDALIRELVADNGVFTVMARRAGKPPREFQLTHLRFENLQFGKSTPFEAEVSNPVPAGVIHTVGRFGPWNGEEPSLTALGGGFRFNADLASIDGIGGQLQAEGSYEGRLERLDARGHAKSDAFRLSTGGADFPLVVDYKATVDGTSGDTLLDSVEADLGQSHISASGAIVREEQTKGRCITLDTRARHGRIEDFIRLTTRVKTSPMVGAVDVTARLDIPPGKGEVIDRMTLAGKFALDAAKFTSKAIQDRIDELSRRGQGRPSDERVDDVASDMRGAFELAGARMTVRTLTFQVEGAQVRLAGAYGVKSERLDFHGELRLQATVSQTQTGWRSLVLKVFDPLFRRKGAGTVLPITVTGTRAQPKFGVEVKKAILRMKN